MIESVISKVSGCWKIRKLDGGRRRFHWEKVEFFLEVSSEMMEDTDHKCGQKESIGRI